MAAIAGSIPNLIGGVSQQPMDIRPINTAALLDNVWLSPSLGMMTRPNSEHINAIAGGLGADDFVAQHSIDKPTGTYIVTVNNGAVRVINSDTGVVQTVNIVGAAATYLNSGSDARDLGFVTVGDTTFIYNKSVTVASSLTTESGLTGATEDSVVRLNPNRYSTLWLKQRLSGTNHYAAYINGTQEALHTTSTNSPDVISADLKTQLDASGAIDSSLKISATVNSIQLKLEADWLAVDGPTGDSSMIAFNDKINEFADITNMDRSGRLVLVEQSDTEDQDDYWVWFKSGEWQETTGWGSIETITVNTMPIILVDNLDGTFDLKETVWPGRTVGDTDSNPSPTFIGNKINNMFIYKGRMVILSDENFIASRVGEFENYFRATCQQLLDDDPIDIASPESSGAPMVHAHPFNNEMLLFSQFKQFELKGDSEGLLSPNTVNIKPVNNYNTSITVSPVVVGPNIIFVDDLGNTNFSGLLEYQVERVFGQQVALSITDGAPEYIPSGVYKIVNSTTDNLLVVATEGERSSLFVYHYYWNSSGKVQAAWSRWTFDGDIYNIDFEGDKLLITMNYQGSLRLLSMKFHLNVDQVITDDSVMLDFREHSDNMTVAFVSPNTTVTVPYDPESSKVILVVSPLDTSGILPPGTQLFPDNVASDVLTFNDVDLTTVDLFVGNPINTEWAMNTIYNRDDKSVPIQDGRLQMRGLSFLYSNTANFSVEVAAVSRPTVIAKFTGITIGSPGNPLGAMTLDSGEFRVAAYGQNEGITITVKSISPWRTRLTSVEWDASYRPKRKRLR